MIRRSIRRLREIVKARATKRLRRAVTRVIADPTPPDTKDSEEDFDYLQSAYPSNRGDSYKYDDYSLFERATQRALQVLQLDGMSEAGKSILDIGAGDGVLGSLLTDYGHHAVLTDMDDWRSRVGKKIEFHQADISLGLPFPDSTFDLVISYNSFEHFPDPKRAFSEAVRVAKPNGQLFFEFGPLYCSPWGLHAYRSLYMPYPQFLFSEGFINEKLTEIGIIDLGKKRSELQFLNQWKWTEFNQLWSSSGCNVCCQIGNDEQNHLDLVINFPAAFRGRGLTLDDLVKCSISVTLKKLSQ
jgi:SAM-dependent methyltransferase